MRKGVFILSLLILSSFLLIGLFAHKLAPFDPDAVDMTNRLLFPDGKHWLGTDHLGRDTLSRLIYGSRTSVYIAFLATGCTLFLGMIMGIMSGYLGGKIDSIIQGITNIFQGIPTMSFVVAVIGLMGPGMKGMLVAIILSSWAGFSRIVRNQVLHLREQHFVEGARALGAGKLYIMMNHILPSLIRPLLVLIATRIGSTILTVASLSFLGLGVQAPASDWGVMVSDAKMYYHKNFITILAPAACITLFCLSINLVADYMRDKLDGNDYETGKIL